uniref:Uncharacterized protein n=1 Tax=Ditylenchus dipsaci TaxID=166011 RepID=A0A915CQQ0_9BILA
MQMVTQFLQRRHGVKDVRTEKFAFDPSKVDAFFHRAALMVLLRAKAKAILAELPEVERAVFNENCSGANRPVSLAKCLVRLFHIRDSLKEKDQSLPVAPFVGLFDFSKTLWNMSSSDESFEDERIIAPRQRVFRLRTVVTDPTQFRDCERNLCRYLYIVKLHDDSMWSVEQLGNEVQNILQASGVDPRKFSILSPKILSIFSNKDENEKYDKRPGLLSPELLSFQNNTGLFSLPQLLGMFSLDKKETLGWLDLMLEMTGAGRSIQLLLDRSANQMKQLEEKLYPSILMQKVVDRRWEMLRSSLTPSQQQALESRGSESVAHTSAVLREKQLELKIQELAKIEDFLKAQTVRRKRDANDIASKMSQLVDALPEISSQVDTGHNIVGGESPDAEHGTDFPKLHVLSPRAFIAAIFSPLAFGAKILSPTAFHGEVGSPEAFTAYVLNPEVLMAEILSPRAFEARVLSPKSLVIQVLSPVAMSPRVGSPESAAVVVLSPNILAPRINSSETYMVEVLSPHILGGEHHSSEETSDLLGGLIHVIGGKKPEHDKSHHEQSDHNTTG